MIRTYTNGKYILLKPEQIGKIEKPRFQKRGQAYSEDAYRHILEASQEYFRQYISHPSTDSFYISNNIDAAALYLDIGNAVTVVKDKNGKYVVDFNGNHRMYIAKKYRLPILVCCAD